MSSCHESKPLQRVIETLKFHQKNDDPSKLVPFIEKEHASLLNDYIKIFKELLNGNLNTNNQTFEEIHNLLIKSLGAIDINSSVPLKRFYDPNKNKKIKHKSTAFYLNLLDSLYVYFLHSYDLGYKIKGKQYGNEEEKNINDTDNEITKLKTYLNDKQSKLKDVIPNYLNENKDNDDIKQNYDLFEYYSYGTRYNYWTRGNDQMYTNKKYANLKEELTNNCVYKLEIDSLNSIRSKAIIFKTSDEFKKIKANKDHETDWYIVEHEALELEHILSLIVCADIPPAFRAYRKVLCGDGEEKEEKELNYEIYQFSRLIREAVECYGTELTKCKYDLFYYPINCLDSFLFGEYIARFNAPILTTPCIESALISTDNGNGYILELVTYDSRLCYFDLSWLSANIMKEQLLFCGGALPLRILNIRQVALGKNYKRFVSALSVLDTIISGERPNERPSKSDLELIYKILSKNNDGFSDYIKNLFEYFVIYAKRITINFYWFKDYYKDLSGAFTSNSTQNMVLIDKMMKFFPSCEYIGIDGGHQGIDANEGYLGELLSIVMKLEKDHGLKQFELKNAKFKGPVIFGQFMELFFNAGFDVNIENNKYDKSLLFKAVEQ